LHLAEYRLLRPRKRAVHDQHRAAIHATCIPGGRDERRVAASFEDRWCDLDSQPHPQAMPTTATRKSLCAAVLDFCTSPSC
jgi:hypothetical protein